MTIKLKGQDKNSSCRCGQSWSDPNVSHFCNLISPINTTVPNQNVSNKLDVQQEVRDNADIRHSKSEIGTTLLQEAATSSNIVNTLPTENIQVFIRIRPYIDREKAADQDYSGGSIETTDGKSIQVHTSDSTIKCSYDAVFGPICTQEHIYDNVRGCTEAFLKGMNSTLFAYGQTGSGKSYTMFGSETEIGNCCGIKNSQAGIIPRAIQEIFERIKKMSSSSQKLVYCSFVQIYNEQLFDLLRDSEMATPLDIHEDNDDGIFVDGLSEYAVRNASDCLSLLHMGEQHRAVRATHMNCVSSRSHSVFQLWLEQRKPDKTVLKSKLNLVDLAGSEKWNFQANMIENHVSEMTNINLSLHTLGRCIAALSSKGSKSSSHIPYRDSKLTRLLQDSLGGNTMTRIIATLSPSVDCINESISTLKFADRARQVMVTVRVNEHREVDMQYVKRLEQEIEDLREIVRTLQRNKSSSIRDEKPASDSDDEAEGNNDIHKHEVSENTGDKDAGIQLSQLIEENLQLKRENKRIQTEKAIVGKQNMENSSVANKQLESLLFQLKQATDRFFKFEIEEDEFRQICQRLFQGTTINAALPVLPKHVPALGATSCLISHTPPSHKVSNRSSSFSGADLLSPPSVSTRDLLYRVKKRRSTATVPSSVDKPSIESTNDWKSDQPTTHLTPEKELEISRRAMEKQIKLQNWLVEKERRQFLKLQQAHEVEEESRRALADRDVKFYKRMAATKLRLAQLTSTAKSNSSPSNSNLST